MNPNEVTVLDAGMGKTLMMRGVEIPKTIWSANALIVAPDEVRRVHLENITAGARVITTNSNGVIKTSLAKVNIEHRYAELNRIAGELARQAVEQSGLSVEIAGSLPPLNGSYRPDRVLEQKVLEPLYREQARLLAPYVDMFVCETMSTLVEAMAAATAALETGKPVLVAFTLHDTLENHLRSGESLQEAINRLQSLDISGLLVNCCLPERVSEAMPLLTASGIGLRGGYANAFTGVPEDWLLDGDKKTDGLLTLREDLSPDFYCRFVSQWIADGANLVGGCCGTTAEHTKAIADLAAQSVYENGL
jgi:S-methylmethionine-dependent homocysteine/selenocysteine methylase